MNWSSHIKNPPLRIAPEDWFTDERAYPYADRYAFKENGNHESYIEVLKDRVTFFGQRGAVALHGINGCQIDDMLTFALGTLQALNKQFPCRENSLAITKLQECLHWLEERTRNRIERKVEGTNRE